MVQNHKSNGNDEYSFKSHTDLEYLSEMFGESILDLDCLDKSCEFSDPNNPIQLPDPRHSSNL